MALDKPEKTTGRIFLGVANETTIERLDAMQAAIRREDWNKNTQELYLFRIREKATAKAKQILGTAYTERQKIIDEAYLDAQKIRDEANQHLDKAKQQDEQALVLQEEAQRKFDTSEEKGFESGLSQANDEITAFRIEIGSSFISVIKAIEKQTEHIFEQWRDDIVELVRICVEKATDWTSTKEHSEIIKSLVLNAVKQLIDRRHINICVHPDDEETVTQLFNFAKEAMPDIKYWSVSSDPKMQQGDLIAECAVNTLHNKREQRVAMVESILNALSLPEGAAREQALAEMHQNIDEQIQKVAELVPEVKEQADNAQQENTAAENTEAENISADAAQQNSADAANSPNSPDASNSPNSPDATAENAAVDATPEHQDAENISADTAQQNSADAPNSPNSPNSPDATSENAAVDAAPEHQDAENPEAKTAQQNSADAPNSPDASNSPNLPDATAENAAVDAAPEHQDAENTEAKTAQQNSAEAPNSPNSPDAQNSPDATAENSAAAQKDAADKLMADLEQELLPLPDQEYEDFDNTDNSAELNSVFATGGFLTTPDKANT